jgi:hexosaminidase
MPLVHHALIYLLPALIPQPLDVVEGPRVFEGELGKTVTYARGMPPESYLLTVADGGVQVVASDRAGAFYADQTLAQLPRPLHEVAIRDAPRFAWRGLHLDVARHFFGVKDIERVLDLMAKWKLNVFHWHLTDDQGWRLPVAKHPELTSTGPAYTADEIRHLVAFAALRHITVVPEIDMPGHMRALLAVHPELSCRGKPLPLPTTYGVFEDVLCIGTPATYALVGDVLDTVEQLFPGPYLHLGGDEAPTARWREHAKDKGLTQRDFLKKVLARVHKRVIGWDEVLEQDAPKDVIVMRWRSSEPVAGHEFVMNPLSLTYLSEPSIRWEDIAAWEPPPGALGVQAAMWTEDVHDMSELEPLLFPRLLALADVAWSQTRAPLGPRLAAARAQLVGVAYDIEAPHGLEPQRAFVDGGVLTLTRPDMFPDAEIRYSVDGGAPSLKYERPISVMKTTDFVAQLFVDGRSGHVARGRYVVEPARAPGGCRNARFRYFEDGKLVREGAVTTLVPAGVRAQNWSLSVSGSFTASATGIYRFDLTSDDGSQLFIGDALLIDNGGDHAPRLRSGEIALQKGCHPLRLEMTQHGGAYTLSLDVTRPGQKRGQADLFRDGDVPK